jgi:hypothetical protein
MLLALRTIFSDALKQLAVVTAVVVVAGPL